MIPRARLSQLRGDYETVYIRFDDDVIRAYKLKMTIKEYAKRFYGINLNKVMLSNLSKDFRTFFRGESVLYVFQRLGADYAVYRPFSWREIAKQFSRYVMFRDIAMLSNTSRGIRVKAAALAKRITGGEVLLLRDLAFEVAKESVEDVKRQLERKERAGYTFKLIPFVERLFGYEKLLICRYADLLEAYGEEPEIAVDYSVKVFDEGVKILVFHYDKILSLTSLN